MGTRSCVGSQGPALLCSLWGRVRICLVNGLNTLPPVSCPLSSHCKCPAAPLIHPPTPSSLKGFFGDLPGLSLGPRRCMALSLVLNHLPTGWEK